MVFEPPDLLGFETLEVDEEAGDGARNGSSGDGATSLASRSWYPKLPSMESKTKSLKMELA